MATAKELGLKKGDVVRIGTQVYEMIPVDDIPDSYNVGKRRIDMTIGPRVEIIDTSPLGKVRVRYLEDERVIGRRNGEAIVMEGNKAGTTCDLWNGYEGFIPPTWMQRGWEFICRAAKSYVGTQEL